MPRKRKLIAGNWKMNGDLAFNHSLLSTLLAALPSLGLGERCEVAVCAPFVYLAQLQAQCANTGLYIGAQDVSEHEKGAYTGEVSAAMLREFGLRYCLVGHSERRQYHHESDAQVARKAAAVLAQGITPIVCVGETLQERESGRTQDVVKRQLATVISVLGRCTGEMVVAYEPVWAIGTGQTATPEQAQEVHSLLRAQLQAAVGVNGAKKVPILYGGSMTPGNAQALLQQADIDGGLIGGAALSAESFMAIVRAAAAL